MTQRSSPWITDILIAVVLVVATAIVAGVALRAFRARGSVPQFYQNMFEPAVAAACGHGFVRVYAEPAERRPLDDFLALKSDRFDCRDFPKTFNPYADSVTGMWLYLFA